MHGFEMILAQELRSLGALGVKIGTRIVDFHGDLGFLYKANYSLSTALRIIKPIYEFTAKTEEELYEKMKAFDWASVMEVDDTFIINSTVFSDYFPHSQYAALKTKDALVDYFREKKGERPSVDKVEPDMYFDLYIKDSRVVLSLDSSGDSLHKRGYKVAVGQAPINEVLAAGMLHLAGWEGKGNFLDPMCGSGTILIEAAMMAAQIPPQLHRDFFAFENWLDFNEELFDKIKEVRLNRIIDFQGTIMGYDKDPEALDIAQKNVLEANLTDFIELKQQDFFTSKKEHFPILLLFNPPYNERLMVDTEALYRNIGDTLKQNYPNTYSWFITSDMKAVKQVGLRPSRKIHLYNGKLECRLLCYETYEGSKKAKNNPGMELPKK